MARHILFLCRENSANSQMAEGLARHFLGHQAEVFSAGLEPADRVHPMAVAVMAEIGIDISRQQAKSLSAVHLPLVELIIVVSEDDANASWNLPPKTPRLHWPLANPARNASSREEQIRRFRKVRDDIRERVLQLRAADQQW